MMDGRQLFAGEPGVGRRLVPAHPSDRQVIFARRRFGLDPAGWGRPSGRVDETRDRAFPIHGLALLDEWLLPKLLAPIAAGVDEPLELGVGDFVSVDPERAHRAERPEVLEAGEVQTERVRSRGHQYHARWRRRRRRQRGVDRRALAQPEEWAGESRCFDGFIPRFLEAPTKHGGRHEDPVERRHADDTPVGFRMGIVLVRRRRACRLGANRDRARDLRQQARENRVVRRDRLRASRQIERFDDLLLVHQPSHVRHGFVAGPLGAPLPHRGDNRERGGGEQDGRERNCDDRTSERCEPFGADRPDGDRAPGTETRSELVDRRETL